MMFGFGKLSKMIKELSELRLEYIKMEGLRSKLQQVEKQLDEFYACFEDGLEENTFLYKGKPYKIVAVHEEKRGCDDG